MPLPLTLPRLLLAALLAVLWLPAAAADPQAKPISVATYNLRLDLASDGPNAWPHRRDAVKALDRGDFWLSQTPERPSVGWGGRCFKRIADLAGPLPVICMGDFNALPDSEAVRSLGAVLRDSRAASLAPPMGPVGTFNGFERHAALRDRIDYVFVSPQWRVLRYAALDDSVDGRYPSDHLPVAVQLVLEPGAR